MTLLLVLYTICAIADLFCAALVYGDRPKSHLHRRFAFSCFSLAVINTILRLKLAAPNEITIAWLYLFECLSPLATGLSIVSIVALTKPIDAPSRAPLSLIILSSALLSCIKLLFKARALTGNPLGPTGVALPIEIRYVIHAALFVFGIATLVGTVVITHPLPSRKVRKRTALPLCAFAGGLIIANVAHIASAAAGTTLPNINPLLLTPGVVLGTRFASSLRFSFYDAQSAAHAILDKISDACIVLDENGCVQQINKAARSLTGLDLASAIDIPSSSVITWTEDSSQKNHFDGELVTVNGSVPVWVTKGTVRDARGRETGTCLFARNRAHRQEMLNALSLSKRLVSLGQLAGSVTHDVRNALTVISGYAEFCQDMLPPGHSAKAQTDAILASCSQAREIAAPLLAFSRSETLSPRPVDLVEMVTSSIDMLRGPLGADLEIVTDLPDQSIICLADPTALHQAVVNIALNAREAMPHGGTLMVRAYTSKVPTSIEGDGNIGCISISDTGPGIENKNHEHLFEPFFTTKDRSQHSGMGLAEVSASIAEMNGTIHLSSSPGHGACFELCIPLAGRTVAAPASAISDTVRTGDIPRALVIAPQRQELDHMLQVVDAAGYITHGVSSWEAGLEIIRKRTERLNLVISSSSATQMDPSWFEQIVHRIRSGLDILHIASGYADLSRIPKERIIQPPLTLEGLESKLRDKADAELQKTTLG